MNPRSKNSSFFLSAIFLGTLFFLNILAWTVVCDLHRPQLLEVNFFNIGQGDAIFVKSPQGHQILIDGGPDSAILEKLAEEMPFWDRTIDLIILTHPEKDHMAGLIEVLKRYKVENILWTGIIRDTPEYQKWIELVKKEEVRIKIAKAGQRIRLSSKIYFDILHPFDELVGQEFKDSNDTSIITKLIFNDIVYLFTGDISSKIEEKLISADLLLKSDILKVAHHGSKYSTAQDFLKEVLPEVAIIQVGKNSYGHPTKEALEILEKFAIKVLRTDENGDIKVISDDKNYAISSF